MVNLTPWKRVNFFKTLVLEIEMQFLYRIQAKRLEMLTEGPTPDEASVLSQHTAYLSELTEQGIVLLAGRTQNTDESSFGIVILQADSFDSAKAIMESDPAVRDGVMRSELYPYKIAFTGKAESTPDS